MSSSVLPPPPILLKQSPNMMKFIPAPFNSFPVSYYALYGRMIMNSNAKVRLNDCHLTGLGIEVHICVLDFTFELLFRYQLEAIVLFKYLVFNLMLTILLL